MSVLSLQTVIAVPLGSIWTPSIAVNNLLVTQVILPLAKLVTLVGSMALLPELVSLPSIQTSTCLLIPAAMLSLVIGPSSSIMLAVRAWTAETFSSYQVYRRQWLDWMSQRGGDRVLQRLTHLPARPALVCTLARLVPVQPRPGHRALVQPPTLPVLAQPPTLLVLAQQPGQRPLVPSLHSPLRSPLSPVPAPDPDTKRHKRLLSMPWKICSLRQYWHL